MNVSLSSWFVILIAIAGANLPFLNERLFAVFPLGALGRDGVKPFWLRLIELFVLYALVGVVAYVLEAQIGNVFRQGWEFYAVTGSLFIVLAYPGFVYRYLRKRRR
ncbi:MAG: DUF2818 family protein [Burkholderiaceae bacterium]